MMTRGILKNVAEWQKMPTGFLPWAKKAKALLPILLLAFTVCQPTHGRSSATTSAFKYEHPCPSNGKTKGACPGYVIDHIKALACGGADSPENMQWQTVEEAKAKDKWERKNCEKASPDAPPTEIPALPTPIAQTGQPEPSANPPQPDNDTGIIIYLAVMLLCLATVLYVMLKWILACLQPRQPIAASQRPIAHSTESGDIKSRALANWEFTYQNANGEINRRQVSLLKMKIRDGLAIGHCHLRGDIRTFYTDAMQDCVDLDTGECIETPTEELARRMREKRKRKPA